LAARDAGVTVHYVGLRPGDGTLDVDALLRLLSPRTRLVAVGCASNATGSINPVAQIAAAAHAVGAEVYLDAVHYAPHGLIDVAAWDCDYLACSSYKFFGPHVGILYGKPERLAELVAYKLRPSPARGPDKWMTGTQAFELIAGATAAVDYLADLGAGLSPASTIRRAKIQTAMQTITEYERALGKQMLAGLADLPSVHIWGIDDVARSSERVPTFAITHADKSPDELATHLAERGIFVWPGNYYALEFTETMNLEPEGMVRIGLLHYNTSEEVQRLLAELEELEA
jgi:cysteine desulfurase family protein (TIGR01976 family)